MVEAHGMTSGSRAFGAGMSIGSDTVIGGAARGDGPRASAASAAPSRAGDSGTGLGSLWWSLRDAVASDAESSLSDSVDEREGVLGLVKERPEEVLRISDPTRARIDPFDGCDDDIVGEG